MRLTRQKFGWAMYDWANSAFATIIIAGFFPVFFKQYWNAGVAVTDSTFRLGVVNSLASLVIVLLAPILGAVADHLGRRKGMLILFATLGMYMTGALYLVSAGNWVMASCFYALALIGFSGSNIFYDSLLPFVGKAEDIDKTSALGFSLGYLGGGLLLAVSVLLTRNPGWIGMVSATDVVRLSFVLVAGWWLVFSLPLIFLVREPGEQPREASAGVLLAGFRRIAATFHDIRKLRHVWMFLLAYWLYIDGVDTIVRMAVDYGLSLGFEQQNLIFALLITQFTAFPAALAFGYLGKRYGAKTGIFLALGIYIVVTVHGALMEEVWEFYFLAFAIGLAQGGIQALSRSMYARMIPPDRTAEYFGFYNMMGKFAAIIGPLLMGGMAALTGNPRAGILSLLVLFLVGALILVFVKVENTEQATI
ncbi:MAG: MFS transporter [Pseudomonadota bacterium]